MSLDNLSTPDVSIIIPARDAARTLGRCIEAALTAADARTEVIVIDDGSRDETAVIASRYPVRLAQTGSACGAAGARNLGARLARGDIFVYTDADVLIPPDTIVRVRAHFTEQLQAAALVGSYAATTPERGFCTAYKNLQAHYIHQTYRRPFPYFVGFAGAIRRSVFWTVSGFDAAAYPSGATVEDVDLGYRLCAAGYGIYLDRGWQVTHLKRYTLFNLIVTDLRGRCIPFTKLRMRRRRFGPEPSMDIHNTLSVAAMGLALLVAFSLISGVIPPLVGGLGLSMAMLACAALNFDFYLFVARHRSRTFVLAAITLDVLGYAYRLIGLALGLLASALDSQPRKRVKRRIAWSAQTPADKSWRSFLGRRHDRPTLR